MIEILVRIGDIQVSNDPGFYLATYGLGTCVAVTMYDEASKTAGMAHVALPDSGINLEKSKQLPGYFADTAIPELYKKMRQNGVNISIDKLGVKIFGGKKTSLKESVFNIGYKNVLAVKDMLTQYQVKVKELDVGGKFNRTVLVDVLSGRVTVKKFPD